MTVAKAESIAEFANSHISQAMVQAVENAAGMCDLSLKCVGVSSVPAGGSGIVTSMIGVQGNVSGFLTVNFSERLAKKAVGRLMQEECEQLNSQVVDGVGEIANIIVGGIKSTLAGSPWAFSQMTVPSIIIGDGYYIAYGKGLEFVCMTFEHPDPDMLMLDDRLMRVSASLLKL